MSPSLDTLLTTKPPAIVYPEVDLAYHLKVGELIVAERVYN